MGNAAVTINHPTSLSHGIPYLESGKIAESIPGMFRMEKRDGAAVGCGGRVQFKKNVAESSWTYKITKQISESYKVGREITIKAESKPDAEDKLSAQFGITVTETRESTMFVKSIVSDNNDYSELYCYVDYEGKDNGEVKWTTKNDLNLNFKHRWAEDSEMIIDINF